MGQFLNQMVMEVDQTNMKVARLYFEAHITINKPEIDNNLSWESFKAVNPKWRCSKFDEDNVDQYHNKWFMSTRHTNLDELKSRIKTTLDTLKQLKFEVIRYKIEDTLLDSKHGDKL